MTFLNDSVRAEFHRASLERQRVLIEADSSLQKTAQEIEVLMVDGDEFFIRIRALCPAVPGKRSSQSPAQS